MLSATRNYHSPSVLVDMPFDGYESWDFPSWDTWSLTKLTSGISRRLTVMVHCLPLDLLLNPFKCVTRNLIRKEVLDEIGIPLAVDQRAEFRRISFHDIWLYNCRMQYLRASVGWTFATGWRLWTWSLLPWISKENKFRDFGVYQRRSWSTYWAL